MGPFALLPDNNVRSCMMFNISLMYEMCFYIYSYEQSSSKGGE